MLRTKYGTSPRPFIVLFTPPLFSHLNLPVVPSNDPQNGSVLSERVTRAAVCSGRHTTRTEAQ